MGRWRVLSIAFVLVMFTVAVVSTQTSIQYVYDELGRLIAVIDPNSDTATYTYDAVGNILSIGRHSSSQVSIISFTPSAAPVGTTVTIAGTGFSATTSQNTVTFNGTAATVASATTTQLVVAVPTGATTGTITVAAPAGSATSTTAFVVSAGSIAPTITSFSPTSGPGATAFSISGTNFDTILGNNRASLNATLLSLASATGTQLTTAVPGSFVTSGRLRVSTPNGTATSSTDFWVAPPGYSAGNLESKIRLAGFGDTNAVTTTLTSTSNVGLVIFDGTPLQRVSMKFSGVTLTSGSASLLSPYGVTLASTGLSTSGAFMDPVTLGSSGPYTYTVMVKPVTTGNVTTTVYDVPPDLTGTLTPTTTGSSATAAIGTPGQNARYTFDGVANRQVSVRITDDSISLAAVSILKPDGSTLTTQSVNTSGGFIDAQTLPVSGTYVILVNPSGANTGNLKVTLYDATEQTGTMPPPETSTTVSTSTPGQNVRLTFAGTASHRMSVKVSSGPAGTVSLLDRDGTTTLGSTTIGATTALVEPVTLPADGTYGVFVNYSGSTTGNVTLTLYDVPVDLTGTITPTATGGWVTADLSKPGQNALYTLGTPTNSRVSMVVSAGPLGTVTVRRPDGTTLTSAGITVISTFIEPWTFASGQTIKVDPSSANTGSVTLTAYDVPPDYAGTLTIGDATPTTVTTTVPGQNGRITFSGTASQQVTVHVTSNHLGVNGMPATVTVKLLSVDGQTALTTSSSALGSFNLATVTLPSTGTYTVSVDPGSTNKGTIDIAVTNP
jgi:YD repeat-containing protein